MSKIELLREKFDQLQTEYNKAETARRKAHFVLQQVQAWCYTVEWPKRTLKQTEVQLAGFLLILLMQGDGEKSLKRKERVLFHKIIKRIPCRDLILEETRKLFGSLQAYDTRATFERKSLQCYRPRITREIGALLECSPTLTSLYKSCKGVKVTRESVFEWLSFYENVLKSYGQATPLIRKARARYNVIRSIERDRGLLVIELEDKLRKIREQIQQEEQAEMKKEKRTPTKTTLIDGQYKGRVF